MFLSRRNAIGLNSGTSCEQLLSLLEFFGSQFSILTGNAVHVVLMICYQLVGITFLWDRIDGTGAGG